MRRLTRLRTRGDVAKTALGIIFCFAVFRPYSAGSFGISRPMLRAAHYRADGRVRLSRPAFGQGISIP